MRSNNNELLFNWYNIMKRKKRIKRLVVRLTMINVENGEKWRNFVNYFNLDHSRKFQSHAERERKREREREREREKNEWVISRRIEFVAISSTFCLIEQFNSVRLGKNWNKWKSQENEHREKKREWSRKVFLFHLTIQWTFAFEEEWYSWTVFCGVRKGLLLPFLLKVIESLTKGLFHQHFKRKFFIQKGFTKLFSVTFWLHNFLLKGYWQKSACKMLMKLTITFYPNVLCTKSNRAAFL